MPDNHSTASTPDKSPLSLSRLREAFAAMLGNESQERGSRGKPQLEQSTRTSPLAPGDVCPRSVVEAMLFVGRPDNSAFSARELAAAMRGVSPKDIDAAVDELSALYEADHAPYQIERTAVGYRLILRSEFERMRDKFYGRVREAKLSPAALEVLSIVAYNQPVTVAAINELRGASSGALLSTLVRRRLVRLDRTGKPKEPALYSTTERFLRLFGLEGLGDLPRGEELGRA
jgi:segregation and condensation protein B